MVFVAITSLVAPWFGREVIVWVVDMAALGTAFGYLYTCVAASRLSGEGDVEAPGDARYVHHMGAVLSVGFIALLCVPGMPGFMAAPSWVALGAWLALGLIFFASQATRYRGLSVSALDGLILRRGGSGGVLPK